MDTTLLSHFFITEYGNRLLLPKTTCKPMLLVTYRLLQITLSARIFCVLVQDVSRMITFLNFLFHDLLKLVFAIEFLRITFVTLLLRAEKKKIKKKIFDRIFYFDFVFVRSIFYKRHNRNE